MTNEQKEFISQITGINMEDGLPNALICFSECNIINTQCGCVSSSRIVTQTDNAAVEVYENERGELVVVLLFANENFQDYVRIRELADSHMRRKELLSDNRGNIKRELWILLRNRECKKQIEINIATIFSLHPTGTATIIAFADDISDTDVKLTNL